MAKFSGLLLVTDIDGTLIGGEPKICEYNAKKIKYFIENGGFFTIATGRCVDACREIIEGVELSAPAAVLNGTVLYDFKNENVLKSSEVDDVVRSACIYKQQNEQHHQPLNFLKHSRF